MINRTLIYLNVDFKLVEHRGMNIKEEGNVPMEDHHEAKNTIEDVSIDAADNVTKNKL